jgi:peptide/nickel transport system permease protein
MVKYHITRLLQTVLILFIVITVVFVILRVLGDPAKLLISPDSTFADLEQMRRVLGLDKQVIQQYLDYLSEILRGDFGNSYYYSRPAVEMIMEHLPATLLLGGVALLISVPHALLVGVIAAIKRNSLLDHVATTITIAGRSVPAFWLGLILILFFSVNLKWFPASGYGSLRQLILPAITMAAGMLASTARLTRSAMLDVMRQDYMMTARAKGLQESSVVVKHGLRNALLSVVTMIALQIGYMFSGSVVIESVFAWPGVGRLMVAAIVQYDYPLVQACTLFMALLFAIINLITDLLYTVIDPRIRIGLSR